jgi:hypothetical protein
MSDFLTTAADYHSPNPSDRLRSSQGSAFHLTCCCDRSEKVLVLKLISQATPSDTRPHEVAAQLKRSDYGVQQMENVPERSD